MDDSVSFTVVDSESAIDSGIPISIKTSNERGQPTASLCRPPPADPSPLSWTTNMQQIHYQALLLHQRRSLLLNTMAHMLPAAECLLRHPPPPSTSLWPSTPAPPAAPPPTAFPQWLGPAPEYGHAGLLPGLALPWTASAAAAAAFYEGQP